MPKTYNIPYYIVDDVNGDVNDDDYDDGGDIFNFK